MKLTQGLKKDLFKILKVYAGMQVPVQSEEGARPSGSGAMSSWEGPTWGLEIKQMSSEKKQEVLFEMLSHLSSPQIKSS